MGKPKKPVASKAVAPADEPLRKNRNFPKHTLEEVLVLPQRIQDEMGGAPMNRLLLADALGMSPSSSVYRELLSSAYKYGLTEGTEKAEVISLTDNGRAATQQHDANARMRALRSAVLTPTVFGSFFRGYSSKKLPSDEMLPRILHTEYGVPRDLAPECASHLATNGRFVEIIREIGGSLHVLLPSDVSSGSAPAATNGALDAPTQIDSDRQPPSVTPPSTPAATASPMRDARPSGPRPIFVGHGKNKGPLHQLQQLLTTFQIPHKVVMDEANLGRPIPLKVKETIKECGSAILIFTRDEKFFDADGKEVWRPSENVVHELGATSYEYGDRIVIFKEKGLQFPTNFQSIGYIEFEAGDLAARTADLLKELIGFGLVKVTPTQ